MRSKETEAALHLGSDQCGRFLYSMKCPLGVGYSGNRITLHSINYVVHKQPVKRDFLVQTFGLLATPLDTRLWTLHEVSSSSNDELLHPLPQG